MCGVGSWLLILLGLLMGLGRPGGLPRGRLGDWPCLVGLLLAGLVGCLVFGVGDTLSAACVWWWWVPPFACLVRVGVACCRGSGAVRPGLPGSCPAACLWVVGCGCGWVGCELYSGREHLTVRFLRQHLFVVVFCCLFF